MGVAGALRRALHPTLWAGLFTLMTLPALAEDPGTVTTRATARDRLANTVADVALGVDAHARTLAEVQAALGAGSTKLSAYIKTTGAERTRTQAVQVQPELEQNPARGQAPGIVGYAGHVAVEFRIEAERLGPVLTEALKQGATTIDGTTLRPSETELDLARRRLAAEATRIALAEALAVAEAAGRRVGAVRAIVVDGAGQQFVPRPMMARMAAPPAAIATDAGDSEVTSSVTVTQALIEP